MAFNFDRALSNAQGSYGGGGSFPSTSTSKKGQQPVYWGPGAPKPSGIPGISSGAVLKMKPSPITRGDETRGVDQADQEFYRIWDNPTTRKQLQEVLIGYGLADARTANDFLSAQKLWGNAVSTAAGAYSAGKKWTPWDALRVMGTQGGAYGAGRGGGGVAGTSTDVRTQVDLTDPTTARGLVNDVLSAKLGRRANADEVRQFTEVLNKAERAAPVTTRTTQTTDGAGNSRTSTSTSGGIAAQGRQQMQTEYAESRPDYGEYQAATTYWSALRAAISGDA